MRNDYRFVKLLVLALALLCGPLLAAAAAPQQRARSAAAPDPIRPAAPTAPASGHPAVQLVGHTGPLAALAVSGSYLYAGHGAGLAVFDLSSPSQPLLVGRTALYDPVSEIVVADGVAYTSYGEWAFGARVQIVDVRDPARPVLIGRLPVAESWWIQALAVSGGRLYVGLTGDQARVLVYDVSTPAAPQLLGSYAFDNPGTWDAISDLRVAGTRVYTAAAGRLYVLDASNPAQIAELGNRSLEGASRFALSGNFVYISLRLSATNMTCSDGLHVLDASTPAQMQQRGSLSLPASSKLPCNENFLEVVDNRLYVLRGSGQDLFIIDVSNPDQPVLLSHIQQTIARHPDYIALHGTTVYASEPRGLYVVDTANAQQPTARRVQPAAFGDQLSISGTRILTYNYHDNFESVLVSGELAFVDASSPGNPQPVAVRNYGGWHHDCCPDISGAALAGERAYVIGDAGLAIYDVSQLASPTLVYTETGRIHDLAVMSDTLFLQRELTVEIYRTAASGRPQLLSSYGSSIRRILAVDDGLLYVEDEQDPHNYNDTVLKIVDVRDPAQPQELGSLPIRSASRMAIANGYAYVIGTVAVNIAGLYAIDVSDPSKPQIVQQYSACHLSARTPYCVHLVDVAVDGSFLYLATYEGLLILDASNPRAVRVLLTVAAPGLVDVELANGLIYVIGEDRGLAILRFLPEHIRLQFLPLLAR